MVQVKASGSLNYDLIAPLSSAQSKASGAISYTIGSTAGAQSKASGALTYVVGPPKAKASGSLTYVVGPPKAKASGSLTYVVISTVPSGLYRFRANNFRALDLHKYRGGTLMPVGRSVTGNFPGPAAAP